jgi:hypothetical protein
MNGEGILVPAELTKKGEPFTIPARSWFEVLRDPGEFLAEARRCNFALKTDVFFGKRVGGVNTDYLQEAYTAGEFGGLWTQEEACKVSLVPERERFPDFRLVFPDGRRLQFESVWADEDGRKVEDEYREFERRKARWNRCRELLVNAGRHDFGEYLRLEPYSADDEEDKAREALARVVEEKAGKGYPRDTRLVVRNNLGHLSGAECRQITLPWHDRFAEIWVLRTPLLFRVHPYLKQVGDPDRWPLP